MTETSMKLFSRLLKLDPFKNFAVLEATAEALNDRVRVYQELDQRHAKAVSAAQAEFDRLPSASSLEKLVGAITARKAFIAADLFKKISDSAYYEKAALMCSPESQAIYSSCLTAIKDELKSEMSIMRSKLSTAFREAGEDHPVLDDVSAVKKLNYQIEEVENAIQRLAPHSLPINDQDVARVLALIHGNLPALPERVKQEGMIEAANRLRRENGGVAATASEPQPENRRSILPDSWKGLRPGPGRTTLAPADARPLGGGL